MTSLPAKKHAQPDQEKLALAHFKKVDPVLYQAALPHRGKLVERLRPKRTNDALFQALCRSVTGQQLSTKAAASIWAKVEAKFDGVVTPEKILRARETTLRGLGLSGAKVKALKALAREVKDGLNLRGLITLTPEEASARLSQIWGIGPWTAEMFLMFTLGAPDIFSPGDLGVVRAIESLYGLPLNAPKEDILQISQAWSPHRSVACLVLWAHRDNKPQ